MSKFNDFINSTLKTFETDPIKSRQSDPKYYIDVPMRVFGADHPNGIPLTMRSFFFGERHPEDNGGARITFLVGQYGTGKTAMLRRLISMAQEENKPSVVPISLGASRPDDPAWVDSIRADPQFFERRLFERFHPGPADSQVLSDLQEKVYSGSILLALDGLDEIVAGTEDCEVIFQALVRFLLRSRHGLPLPHYDVIVSARSEFLVNVGLSTIDALKEALYEAGATKEELPEVYLVRLDHLGEAEVEDYMKCRGQGHHADLLKDKPKLAKLLQRPLLLKLFCDYLVRIANDSPEPGLETPVELLQAFLASHQSDEIQLGGGLAPVKFSWGYKELASTAMELYKRAGGLGFEFPLSKVRNAVTVDATVGQLHATTLRMIVHKCPFVIFLDEESCAFSHRVFYEYFVAQGVLAEMKTCADEVETFDSFDELILNVDMRKFLKDLVEKRKINPGCSDWQARTRISYALGNHHLSEWAEFGCPLVAEGPEWRRLEKIRWGLLQIMTVPEEETEGVERLVRDVLAMEESQLHPRYRMYNLEAVAVYLLYRLGKSHVLKSRDRFSKLLEKRLRFTIKESNQAQTAKVKNSLLLLVEKCIDIARRLRFPWIQQWSESEVKRILEQNSPIWERAKTVCSDQTNLVLISSYLLGGNARITREIAQDTLVTRAYGVNLPRRLPGLERRCSLSQC